MAHQNLHLAGAILHFVGSHNISKKNSNSFNSYALPCRFAMHCRSLLE